jgi:hypothetical protein
MYCELCRSGNEAEFTSEMMIHFSGLPNIDNLGIPAFPKISVCLDCGFSRFSIPEPELSLLAEGTRTSEPSIGLKNVGNWPPRRTLPTDITSGSTSERSSQRMPFH